MITVLMQSEFMLEADAVEFVLDFIVHEGRLFEMHVWGWAVVFAEVMLYGCGK